MVRALLLVTDLLFDATAVVVATTGLAALGCLSYWCLAPLRRRAAIAAASAQSASPRGAAR